MAATSSSSCADGDLTLAASCDNATSQLFFSKGGGGDGDSSWPAAAEIESKLTNQESLVALCDKYGVPREFQPVCADTLRGCGLCQTPPHGSNALCIYSDALEAGLRFPLHDFYLKLLRHYRLAPSQLVPNAWKYMAAFVLRCKDAGVQPLVSAFRYFFSLYAHQHKHGPTGWYHFQPCPNRPRLFSGTLPTKYDWKSRFFFLKSPEGMPWKCSVAWGKPRMEDAAAVELTDAVVDKLKQMPSIDLRYFLGLHDPPVGDLTLPQLQSTPTPLVKRECAPTVLEAGARAASAAGPAGEGDGDHSTPRKRRCPDPSPTALTPQHGMLRMQDKQRDNQIAQLQVKLRESEDKLRESKAMSDKFLEYLCKQRAENDLLKKKHAGLIEEQAAIVSRVKAEHMAKVTKLLQEHAATIARLNKEHAADLARQKDAADKKVQDVMKKVVRSLYSQLEGPELIGDLATAGTPEAEGRSATL